MVHSSRIDQRILAILDPSRCRHPVGRRFTFAAFGLTVVACGLLAGVTLEQPAAIASPQLDSRPQPQTPAPVAPPEAKPTVTAKSLVVIAADNLDQVRPVLEIETGKRTYRIIRGPKPGEFFLLDGKNRVEVVDDSTWNTLRKIAEDRQLADFAVSSDGKVMMWRETDKKFHTIEDVATGMTISFESPGSAAFSPDGTLIASGDTYWDPKVEGAGYSEMKLFDRAGKLVHALERSNAGTLTPVFSPDGKTLAVGNRNYETCLFDVASGKLRHSLSRTMTHEIAFSPDGKTLAAGYVDGTVALWEVATGKLKGVERSGCEEVYTLDWSPKGDLLAAAGSRGNIVVWDTRDLKKRKELAAPVWVNQVRFTADGTRIVSSSASDVYAKKDLMITIWAVGDDSTTKTVIQKTSRVEPLPRGIELGSIDVTFSDAKWKELATLKHLTRLSLHGRDLTDEGFTEVATLKNLKTVHLENTSVTNAGAEKLQQALPTCRISLSSN